ncbi:MAG: hypothetical protein MSA80_03000, partial [Prevotella sp.]|nr:hypothetical protein [Prevotella sp.]
VKVQASSTNNETHFHGNESNSPKDFIPAWRRLEQKKESNQCSPSFSLVVVVTNCILLPK